MTFAIQLATLATVATGFVGVVVAIWSHRKALHAQTVIHYAERFERLLDQLPSVLLCSRSVGELPPPSGDLTRLFVKYFNFTYEEWYMSKKRYFPRDLWRIWRDDICSFVSHPLVVREWETIKMDFEAIPGFYAFIDGCARQPEGRARSGDA